MTVRGTALALTLILAVLLGPLGTDAQPPGKPYRIGWLNFGTNAQDPRYSDPFRHGLRELGWVEGQHFVIEERSAERRADRFPGLAADLVRSNVDVIVTASGEPAILAAKNATTTIPIVMIVSADPVATGLVGSLARPGGNVTGLSIMAPDVAAKRLQLLKEVVPRASRVAVLWNAAYPGKAIEFRETQAAARALGVIVQSVEVRQPADFDRAFASIDKGAPDALITFSEPLASAHRGRIIDFAAKHRLPMISEVRAFADSGALMTYGPDARDLARRAAHYVERIFRGAKPADLPVEQPTRFYLVINLRTARALGLTMPPSVLIRADHLIE